MSKTNKFVTCIETRLLQEQLEHLLGWMRYVRLPVGEQLKNDFAADLDASRNLLAALRNPQGKEQAQ